MKNCISYAETFATCTDFHSNFPHGSSQHGRISCEGILLCAPEAAGNVKMWQRCTCSVSSRNKVPRSWDVMVEKEAKKASLTSAFSRKSRHPFRQKLSSADDRTRHHNKEELDERDAQGRKPHSTLRWVVRPTLRSPSKYLPCCTQYLRFQ